MEVASAGEPRLRARVRLYRHQLQEKAGPMDTAAEEDTRRQRLLDHTARLDVSNQRLRDSHRLALESESVGADILSQLRGQRETLEATRNTLGDTDSSLDRATKMLKSMSRRFF
ncbi:snare region anchored in the vesicle membrane C-terminus-domain-containing protein [Syncephalastrum racemosum]|uniref:Snare region anchored in the vesicle membrane C-terminus-domain-containing protein n=1 Tax=Syncephalastrum racemosum TaxID=13706 RepID=A0A1X2HBI0_SYNRA|nr:snare region anchored in the vesicle membrane C-terminus-domain-containing protein [Syncephalastrum racemosum]